MKSTSAVIVLLLFSFLAAAFTVPIQAMNKKPKEQYRHVVMFQFKADVTEQQVQEVEAAFMALGDKIVTVVDIEFGRNVSPENLNQGLTHCFLVTFKDKAGLEVYLPHPAHKNFVSLVQPRLEKVMVIDYVSK